LQDACGVKDSHLGDRRCNSVDVGCFLYVIAHLAVPYRTDRTLKK
jgi:hypothetical protein